MVPRQLPLQTEPAVESTMQHRITVEIQYMFGWYAYTVFLEQCWSTSPRKLWLHRRWKTRKLWLHRRWKTCQHGTIHDWRRNPVGGRIRIWRRTGSRNRIRLATRSGWWIWGITWTRTGTSRTTGGSWWQWWICHGHHASWRHHPRWWHHWIWTMLNDGYARRIAWGRWIHIRLVGIWHPRHRWVVARWTWWYSRHWDWNARWIGSHYTFITAIWNVDRILVNGQLTSSKTFGSCRQLGRCCHITFGHLTLNGSLRSLITSTVWLVGIVWLRAVARCGIIIIWCGTDGLTVRSTAESPVTALYDHWRACVLRRYERGKCRRIALAECHKAGWSMAVLWLGYNLQWLGCTCFLAGDTGAAMIFQCTRFRFSGWSGISRWSGRHAITVRLNFHFITVGALWSINTDWRRCRGHKFRFFDDLFDWNFLVFNFGYRPENSSRSMPISKPLSWNQQ